MSCTLRAVVVGFAIAASAYVLAERGDAATITVNTTDGHGRTFVDVVGEIAAGDDEAFERKVAVLHTHVDKVIVTLSGPGGAAVPAMNIGERVHKNGWATYVPSGTICTSACATIWLAGTPRMIEGAPNVMIGFHAAFNAQTKAESGVANAILGSHFARWGLSDLAVACVTIVPPSEMGWLSGPDGKACDITWEILTPARDVPFSRWQPPPLPQADSQLPPVPPQKPPPQASRQDVFWHCSPTLSRGDELDPVTIVFVGVEIRGRPGDDRIEGFDAWHYTAKGNIYKRSEQYGNRAYSRKSASVWEWNGHRQIKGRDIYMIGQLALANGIYAYREWIAEGDSYKQVTDTVCTAARGAPQME